MHRKILAAGVLAVIACAMVTQASTPPADSAEQLLLKAQRQFQKKQYTDARKSLWNAYQMRTTLSAPHQRMLQQRLAEVDDAIERNILAAAATRPVVAPVAPKVVVPAPKPVVLAAVPKDVAPKPWPAASKVAVVPAPVEVAPVKVAPVKVAPKIVPVVPAPVAPVAPVATGPTPAQASSIKVQQLVAQGKSALAKNDFAAAEASFQAALKINPKDVQARKGMNAVTIGLARTGETSMLTKYIQQKKIAAQKVRHEYDMAMKKSYELMLPEVGDKGLTDASFTDAVAQANAARASIQNAQSLFTAVEYRRFLNEVDRHLNKVAAKRDDWNLYSVRKQKIEVGKMKADLAARTLRSRQTKIKELTSQALSLRADRKYIETLQVVEEILKLDPDNDWAQDNAYSLRNYIILEASQRNKDDLNEQLALLAADIKRVEIPWYQELRYPKNWKELTKIREAYGAGEASESEENRNTRSKLMRKMVDVQLVKLDFQNAIEYIRENTGANIYVNWPQLELGKDDIRNQKITVQLSNVPAETVLKKILEEGGGADMKLGYVIEDGVVNIATTERLNERTFHRTYDIRDLLARIPNFAGPRVDLKAIGQRAAESSGDGSSSGGQSGDSLFKDQGKDTGKVGAELTKQEMSANLIKLIMETVERDSWVINGGTATCSEISGTLVIGQTAKNHREVRDLISSLRENRTIQVSIEARFIEVKTGFLNQIGVDLDVYFNIGSNLENKTLNLSDGDRTVGAARVPFVFVDANTGEYISGVDSPWNASGVRMRESRFSPVAASQSSADWVWSGLAGRETNVPGGIGSTISNAALTIAGTFLDDIQVDFLIRATQAHDSTRTLIAPRITLLNGQRAYVSVATQQAYIAGLEPIVGTNSVGFRTQVAYAPNGAMLDVDATVSHDRRYVTLTLRPQVVTLNLSAAGVGGIDYIGGVGLPNITLQDLQTTVSVPDGGTLLLGGLRLSTEVEREMGVPVVSKLPILNRAFTNKGKLRDESTLLILVKPKILINDEQSRNLRNHSAVSTVPEGFSR